MRVRGARALWYQEGPGETYFSLFLQEADVQEAGPRRLDGEGKLRTPEGIFSTAPFSTGQRNCVGQALAMGQLKQVVAALTVRFVFEVVKPPTPDYFLTLKPSGAKLRAQSWSNAA